MGHENEVLMLLQLDSRKAPPPTFLLVLHTIP